MTDELSNDLIAEADEQRDWDGPDDFTEPDLDDGSNTWTRWHIWMRADGKCDIDWATNDDDDDGYEDSEIATAQYRDFEDIWKALEFTGGGTHVGVIGCQVDVHIDGQRIHSTWTEEKGHNEFGHPRYLPYCMWLGPRKDREDAYLEDVVDEIMQDVTAFILEHKIDTEMAQEFVRQTTERAKKRLKVK